MRINLPVSRSVTICGTISPTTPPVFVNSIMERAAARAETNGIPTDAVGRDRDETVPALPGARTGPLVWSGEDFGARDAYTWRLTSQDVEEIDYALRAFKCTAHTPSLFTLSTSWRGRRTLTGPLTVSLRPGRRQGLAENLSAPETIDPACADGRDYPPRPWLSHHQRPRSLAIFCPGQRDHLSGSCELRRRDKRPAR
ncbi:hypothetical protein CDD83_1653 [Cordyceps sp. RAO-2017]|nr:hypothetical protein CDD83_1653 [Cordyceps sp. RAO-2017]